MSRFKVIRDSREKKGHGWWFEEDAYCIGTEIAKVDIGDYAIEGMEHLLCIERKESVSEFAGNCGEKRFHKELENMSTFPHAFLLLEFNWTDIERYPQGSGIPQKIWRSLRIKGKYMQRVISSIQLEHGVHVVACGDKKRAEEMAFLIMRKVYELHKEKH
jgi:hypothetical protein|tara:strand:- start:8814 stop:9293 length:480 start_codon:yes stop_codon:yes gene_type:complete